MNNKNNVKSGKNEENLKILRSLHNNPNFSQRDHADFLGVSLGKINYLLKSLSQKGMVKANNFSKSKNKLNYIYILTPRGFKQKFNLTIKFMKIKIKEYDELKKEMEIKNK